MHRISILNWYKSEEILSILSKLQIAMNQFYFLDIHNPSIYVNLMDSLVFVKITSHKMKTSYFHLFYSFCSNLLISLLTEISFYYLPSLSTAFSIYQFLLPFHLYVIYFVHLILEWSQEEFLLLHYPPIYHSDSYWAPL